MNILYYDASQVRAPQIEDPDFAEEENYITLSNNANVIQGQVFIIRVLSSIGPMNTHKLNL